jgi:hypothetical protein
MGIRVDFTGVSTGFEAIPAGKYHVKVTNGEMKESGPSSKNPGAQYVAWELTVQSGDFTGRKLFLNTSLLPKALFGLKGLLAAVGHIDKEDQGEIDFEIEDVVGSDCVARVGVRKYEGEDRNDVKGVEPWDESFSGDSGSDDSLMP